MGGQPHRATRPARWPRCRPPSRGRGRPRDLRGAGRMSATFKLPLGEVPGQVFIGLRTTDVLTHAWDLAAATGQSTDLDPELAVERLAAARALGAAVPRAGKALRGREALPA